MNRTPDSIANEIRMLRTQWPGAFLLVEGSSDRAFFRRFVDSRWCRVQVLDGKDNVLAVQRILNESSFPGALGVVDADFWVLDGFPLDIENVVATDVHDLEMLLIRSPALDHVLRELGSEPKIDRLRERFKQEVRDLLLTRAVPIGLLRWCASHERLRLNFDGLAFSRFTDRDTLEVNEDRLVEVLRTRSPGASLSAVQLHSRLAERKKLQPDLYQLCCGHDVTELLSLGLRKLLGSRDARDVAPDALERSLRLAYEVSYFLGTRLAAEIRAWEAANPNYRVFAGT